MTDEARGQAQVSQPPAPQSIGEAFQRFLAEWRVMNPPPSEPRREEREEESHTLFLAMLAVTVATGIGVAFRTAQAFYRAAQDSGLSWALAGVEAFMLMLGVEGTLVLFEVARVRLSVAEGRLPDSRAAVRRALIAAGLISAAAGLRQSLGLAPWLPEWMCDGMGFILALLTGVGGTFLLYAQGHYLGVTSQIGEVQYLRARREYENASRAWLEAARRAFQQTEVYARLSEAAGFNRKRRSARSGRSGTAFRNSGTGGTVPPVPEQVEQPERNNGTRSAPALEKALAYLEAWARENPGAPLPGPRQVMREAGVGANAATRALRIFGGNSTEEVKYGDT